ncbi:peptidoglycan/xylan/chitin deacetylase (PgdA/CDA1 family) [Bradyrhizobium yuanmingense]
MQARGIVVFRADLWASDWENITPEQELTILIKRLEAARKGIILLHDAQTRTAAMLPTFLRYVHQNGYRIVHPVPAAAKSAEAPLTSWHHAFPQ